MSETTNHLNHSAWGCKYHFVFTPKYRKKELHGLIRKELKGVFHRLSAQKHSMIEEGFLMPDHAHMLLSILAAKTQCLSMIGYVAIIIQQFQQKTCDKRSSNAACFF